MMSREQDNIVKSPCEQFRASNKRLLAALMWNIEQGVLLIEYIYIHVCVTLPVLILYVCWCTDSSVFVCYVHLSGWVDSIWSAGMCIHQCGALPSGNSAEVP